MLLWLGLLAIFVSALFATWAVIPFFIRRMHLRGITGKDINKNSQPAVAEMGGTTVLMGFIFSVMMALALNSYLNVFPSLNLLALLAAMLTIVLVGLLGIIDDLIGWKNGIRQYQHALIPVFAALPLMVLPEVIGNTGVDVPLLGFINFGIFYSLILVPLAVTGASNATNMLAGLNGLEGGMALINSTVILIVAIILGEVEVAILMLGLIGAILAFLKFNWFPAKIFPGDSFTLMNGASIAAVVIIGNMEKVGLMLFGLYFIELLLKARTKFQGQSFGIVQEDGTLKAPEKTASLTHVIMRHSKLTEKQVVMVILAIQVAIALFTLFIFWENYLTTARFSGGRMRLI